MVPVSWHVRYHHVSYNKMIMTLYTELLITLFCNLLLLEYAIQPDSCCVIVNLQVQVSLDELFVKSMDETDPRKNLEVAKDLVSATLLLIEAYTIYIR